MKNCWIAFLASVVMVSCAHRAGMVDGEPRPESSYTEKYILATLDRVFLHDKQGTETVLVVSQTGEISLPNSTTFYALGMTPEALEKKIKKSYPEAKKVRVEEFRGNRVTVMGEVFHQIHVEMSDSPMRVMDVIAAANGFTPLADRRRVKLIRQNAGNVTVYELNMRDVMNGKNTYLNMLVRPGDVITVPRTFL